MQTKKTSLPVTVDKSHLIVIGEKLYTESIELLRELVNNAYDADATEVNVTISSSLIKVEDNGLGMDLKGLEQYFAIGSPEKVAHPISSKFKRHRIGQFGIGKFATLSACNRFQVYTQKEEFAAQVTFDKEEWQETSEKWYLPLEHLTPDLKRGDGTSVILSELTKDFSVSDVEERLRESTPLKASHFKVKINGRRINPKRLPGYRIPFMEGTKYGMVHGEIVIIPSSQASILDFGIDCKVKQVTIKRELFDLADLGKEAARIKGEINADFLPITSDRSSFIVDSDEYKAFCEVMKKVLKEVRKAFGILSDKKENKKARAALREALNRIEKALNLNPSSSPQGMLPLSDTPSPAGDAASISEGKEAEKGQELVSEGEPLELEPPKPKKRRKKAKAKQLTPNAVVRKLKIGNLGITCCLDHFGPEGLECFTEETVIFINRDHPLYQREARKRDACTMYISRLLAQEISMMNKSGNPRKAYELQSKILRNAFIE